MIGVSRISRELVSINVPRIIRRITTREVITNLLQLKDNIASATMVGTLFLDNTHPKGAEAETIMSMNAVLIALCLLISRIALCPFLYILMLQGQKHI
ncbi:MAG: hypothetical protein V8T45_00215 [Oscillospiraceae bacterium]